MFEKISSFYSNLSIAKKLKFTGIITAFIAGGLSIIFVSIFQYQNKKMMLETETIILSKIVAENISSAVVFNDKQFITTSLQSLEYQSRVEHAYVMNSQFNELSSYHNHQHAVDEKLFNDLYKFKTHIWDERELYTIVPINSDNDTIGHLIIISSLNQSIINITKEMLIIIFIVFISMIISFRFRVGLINSILIPIAKLNESTNKVIKTRDLDTEVKVYNNDEIGELAQNFNYMIKDIQKSNKRLQQSNEDLEQRVNERTNELSILNEELDHRVKKEVSKRNEQEQILIQQSRFAAMGEMIGNIAHQWRQPLNALGLLLQNIEYTYEMGLLDEKQIKRTVEKGNRLTSSMSQTIDDFRNFFKPNQASSTFNIASTIESSIDMLRSGLVHNAISINEDIDSSVYIQGISNEFSQVALNLLNNARDALIGRRQEDRQLYIKVFKDIDYAYLTVEDNAGGIDKSILEKVFDPYFTTKDEGNGTGIGLYMSKTIIENHMNGLLEVENSTIGAKFTIKIKLEEAKDDAL